jgi:hypothetical protein
MSIAETSSAWQSLVNAVYTTTFILASVAAVPWLAVARVPTTTPTEPAINLGFSGP